MIKEHLEITGVNTLIFLPFESYSDGKIYRKSTAANSAELCLLPGPLCYISKVSTSKSKNNTLPDIHSIAFIYTHIFI